MSIYRKLLGGLLFVLFANCYSALAQTGDARNFYADRENSSALFDVKNSTPLTEKDNSSAENPDSTLAPKSSAAPDTDAPVDWKLQRGEKELNVELGIAPTHPTNFNGKEFDTTGRKFALLSLRWGRIIGTPKKVTYEYQIEVAPLAIAFKNEVVNPAFQTATLTPNAAPTVRENTRGFAVSPIGFRFLFRPEKRLKPFIALHAGFIFFARPVPLPRALSYGFTGDFGGGGQYQIKKNRAVSFGYRYYHISNINIGEINPGYNAQVFYFGYSFFYK